MSDKIVINCGDKFFSVTKDFFESLKSHSPTWNKLLHENLYVYDGIPLRHIYNVMDSLEVESKCSNDYQIKDYIDDIIQFVKIENHKHGFYNKILNIVNL